MKPMRLACFLGALASLAMAMPAGAEEPINLAWEQLIPPVFRTEASGKAWGEVMHGQMNPAGETSIDGAAVVSEFDGKRVRIPGFMVPLDLEAEGIKEFLLVPFFGACIHVPPPPPNQIVYVSSEEGVEMDNPFDAVVVTGMLTTTGISTELADVGYRLAADGVEPMQAEPWTGGMSGYLNQQQSK